MTSALTSVGQPRMRELTDSAAAARYIADTALADGAVGRVGLELEAHCFELTDLRRRPDWARLTEVIDHLPRLPGGSRVSVEPGGAVELSGPPGAGPLSAIAAMQADHAVLRAAFTRAGLGLLLLGADPLRAPLRVNPAGRYRAMEQFFAAAGTAAPGAAMMTSTASIQLNLDAGPRSGWADRVRLAHALGPTMIAMTANSALRNGRFTGWLSSRQQVWGALDPARCGPVLGAGDPATDWSQYALKAPVMLVFTPDAQPVLERVPFADWADGRVLLGGRRPTIADLDYHLTTLFPPVRPRRWLEIRYLDALPETLWPVAVFILATLMDNADAAALAAQIVAPVATAWETAARIGLGDRRLYTSANRCLALVREIAPPEMAEPLRLLTGMVERGRCPGDDFAEAALRLGIDTAVTQRAEGES